MPLPRSAVGPGHPVRAVEVGEAVGETAGPTRDGSGERARQPTVARQWQAGLSE